MKKWYYLTTMNRTKYLFSLILILGLLVGEVGEVFAASPSVDINSISGVVQSILLETDPTTGVTTVVVSVMDNDQLLQEVRISQETAITLGLVVLNEDGKPLINNLVLGGPIEIDVTVIIPQKETLQHPVGSALATYFSNVPGLDYETVMKAHRDGTGFGVIAHALWLTDKLEGNSEVFKEILAARQTGDYSVFIRDDGTSPKNWGELRNAILEEKDGLGVVISDKENNGNGNGNGNGNNPGDDGNGNGNGNGNNNGGGNGNGNNNGGGNGNGNGNNGDGNGNGNGNKK